ncbi:MAG: DUF4013 domain-containing protein [Olegusella sp.]|jgi:hypothetical protein|nr:DUF4013 domain-containing protein [Olegusella sp.]NLH92210.1 DUF4013 domain-containing protein [Atopobium sp.]
MQTGATGHYYARSLALLKRDRGWLKPLLVLASALFVPIVGELGVLGFGMEWARLTAWGFDAAPKQKKVKVGACIKSGWRAFIASLGCVAIMIVADWLVTQVFSSARLDNVGNLITLLINVFGAVIVSIASLHAVIYSDFKAGYHLRRIGSMLKRDFRGVAKIAGMSVVLACVIALVLGIIFFLVLFNLISKLIVFFPMLSYVDTLNTLTISDGFMMISLLLTLMRSYAPVFAILLFLLNCGLVFFQLITINAVGLWMRAFDVPAWGKSSDPLPIN